MSKIKYCPNCRTEKAISLEKCDMCGYEFYNKLVEDEIANTNTVIIVDKVPENIWAIIGFICPIAGYILAGNWWKTRARRAKISLRWAIVSSIIILLIIILLILIIIGSKNGNVIV